MTTDPAPAAPNETRALDRQDERVTQYTGLGGVIKATTTRVRSGDLGALPVVVGLVLICIVFQALNPLFLSSQNLVNLTLEASSVGVISLGVVCVLLVGEIDLSVGSVSGLSGALVAVLGVQKGWPMPLAIATAVATGLLIGALYGQAFTRFGMPSFVATLAGLLGFLGLQLFVLGAAGSINIPFNSGLVRFAQQSFLPRPVAYLAAALVAAVLFIIGLENARARTKAGLSAPSVQLLLIRSGVVLAALEFAAWYLNRTRGWRGCSCSSRSSSS